jgi:hypothetical protein
MKKINMLLLSVALILNYVNLFAQAEAPANFKATIVGSLVACHLSWTNPVNTITGEPITDIIKVVLTRDNETIKEFDHPQTGEECHFTDHEIPTTGTYEYAVYAVTADGNGQKSDTTINLAGALCNFRFVLSDLDGIGWPPISGIRITVDEVDYGFVNLAWGSAYTEEIVPLPSGEIQFYWTGTVYDYTMHFEIYNPSNELIYTNPDYLIYEGLFFTYQHECLNNTECLPVTDFEGVYIPEKHQVQLSWKAPESTVLQGFDIYRNDILIDHLLPTIFYVDNTAGLETGAYKYCIIPVYSSVCTLNDECFETSINVGVIDYKDNIVVYPNPANDIVNISGTNIANVKIFNCMGQQILNQHHNNEISVSNLPNGIYILSIELSTKQIIRKKLIIQH